MASAPVGTEWLPLVAMVIDASPAAALVRGMFAVRDQLAVDADLRAGIPKRQGAIVSSRDDQRQIGIDEADLAANGRPREALGKWIGPVVHRYNRGQPAVSSHIVPSTIDVDTRETVPVKVQREKPLMPEVEMSGGVRPCAMFKMKDIAFGFRRIGATVVGVAQRAGHGPRGSGKHRCDREYANQGRSMVGQGGHVAPPVRTCLS